MESVDRFLHIGGLRGKQSETWQIGQFSTHLVQNVLNNAVLWLSGWDYSVVIVTTCAWFCYTAKHCFFFLTMLCAVCCWERSQNGSGRTPVLLSETSETGLPEVFSSNRWKYSAFTVRFNALWFIRIGLLLMMWQVNLLHWRWQP